MNTETKPHLAQEIAANLKMILLENQGIVSKLDFTEVVEMIPYILNAQRIFVVGAGRTGLALQALAMRLMHLGFQVYMVGETTTPAIQSGDLLIAASGSGTTGSIVKAAEKAKSVQAQVFSISTTKKSQLADSSSFILVIPAAQKTDHGTDISQQYAGSLFEQAVLLLTDALIQTLWRMDGTPAEELWKRHANLE
jgi:6-phospho-3-hexuloisomerase